MSQVSAGQIGLNYRGAAAQTLFLDPVFTDIMAESIMTVMSNVEGQQRMYHAGQMQDILQEDTGCGFDPKGQMDIYKRQISTKHVKVALEQCWDEFINTVHLEALNKGLDVYDLQNTAIMTALLDRVQKAIVKDCNKLAFFGDQTIADPNINILDGLWKLIREGVTANLIARTDTQSGTALSAGDAIDYLDAVYEKAPNELDEFDDMQKRIFLAKPVYFQLERDIRDGITGDGLFADAIINGIKTTTYRGVPLIKMSRWEALAKAYWTGADHNNLILYTTNFNLVLATNRLSDKSAIMTQYEPFERKTRVMASFTLGFNYLHESLMSVGY